jgi:hypothetical protein
MRVSLRHWSRPALPVSSTASLSPRFFWPGESPPDPELIPARRNVGTLSGELAVSGQSLLAISGQILWSPTTVRTYL